MITKFICTAKGCPNENVEYQLEDAPKTAICGGCSETLRPVAE